MVKADPKRVRQLIGRKRTWGPVIVALIFALVPLPDGAVEHFYSSGFYSLLQPPVTFASNAIPVSLFDALAAGLLIAFVGLTARDASRSGASVAVIHAVRRLVIWSAAVYVIFLLTWGFNYRRQRMIDRLPFDRAAVTPAAASRLAALSVDRLNALHARAHADGWLPASVIDPALAGAFERAMSALGATNRIVVARPKRSLLDWYFTRAGVSGMTDPVFLETLLATDLLPFERPFVIAHEWSHLGGLADEGEANVAGWLACLRGLPAHQYSGWLFMYGELARVIPARDRAALTARLASGPRADLRAIRERLARNVSPVVSGAGWRVYDTYLKANRVEAGAASYDDVVHLALGLRAAQRLE